MTRTHPAVTQPTAVKKRNVVLRSLVVILLMVAVFLGIAVRKGSVEPRNCAVIQQEIAVIKRIAVKRINVVQRKKSLAVIPLMTAVMKRNVVRK